MKKALLLTLILFIIPLVNGAISETHLFSIGGSFEFAGRNVTLLEIGSDKENIVVCVNNKLGIINDENIFSDITFYFENMGDNYANLRLKTSNQGLCDASCSNELCFKNNIPQQNQSSQIFFNECDLDNECNDNSECTLDKCFENKCVLEPIQDCNKPENKTNFLMLFSTILLIWVIILLFILFFIKKNKKKKR